MAVIQTLHDAFLDELRDSYDAEKQLTKALPKLARVATGTELKQAFIDHLGETQGHVRKLEQVFQLLDEKARGKHCDGIAGIIDEGSHVMEEDFEGVTLDACLIAAGQRAEHYEMAAYGTLVAWAKAMGHTDAADLLQEILDEEKAADETLTAIAESGVNDDAASGAQADDEEDADARPRRTAAAAVSRRSRPKRKK
jgi:ferritin-like metal-binding protein YciE